jgi:hypothetical protein
MRAHRQRRATEELVQLPDLPNTPPIKINSGSVDEQIARGLLEVRMIGFAFQRLGTQARPDLAWRCTKLGDAIIHVLKEAFAEIER